MSQESISYFPKCVFSHLHYTLHLKLILSLFLSHTDTHSHFCRLHTVLTPLTPFPFLLGADEDE